MVDETTASFVSHLHHEREYSGVLSTVKGIFSNFKAYAIAVNVRVYAVLSTAIVVNNNTSVVNPNEFQNLHISEGDYAIMYELNQD